MAHHQSTKVTTIMYFSTGRWRWQNKRHHICLLSKMHRTSQHPSTAAILSFIELAEQGKDFRFINMKSNIHMTDFHISKSLTAASFHRKQHYITLASPYISDLLILVIEFLTEVIIWKDPNTKIFTCNSNARCWLAKSLLCRPQQPKHKTAIFLIDGWILVIPGII